MSKLAELASHVLDLVSEELEVSKQLILSKSRKTEVVDARHLAIRLIHSKDVYPSRIATLFGLTTRNVHHALTMFDVRMQANNSLRNIYAKIAKQLGDNHEISRK